MQKLFLALIFVLLSATLSFAHGGISKLPDSVQIMQYKMKLYLNADDLDSKNYLAMAYFRTNKLDEAKKELSGILMKDESNFNALDGMGIVLLKEGNADRALVYLNKARAVNDKDFLLYVHLSLAHKQLGQADLAKADMDRAKSLASGPADLAQIQKEIQLLLNS